MPEFAQKERPPQSSSQNCSNVNRQEKQLPTRSLSLKQNSSKVKHGYGSGDGQPGLSSIQHSAIHSENASSIKLSRFPAFSENSSQEQGLHSKVENVLASFGELNDSNAGSLPQAHLGHDFSRVKIYANQKAMPPVGLTASGPIQAKLAVSQPGDEYEREADRVTSTVMHQIHEMQPQCRTDQCLEFSGKKGEKIQIKPTSRQLSLSSIQKPSTINTLCIPPNLEAAIYRAQENGRTLPDEARKPMEQAFGADFARVRIHTDEESSRLNQMLHARAFTVGHDVFFQRTFNPITKQGQELLAHELTHVAQQSKSNLSGGVIQLTPADFIDALYDNLDERIIQDRLLRIIRSLESGDLQEARILYARLMMQDGALALRFERRLPTYHEDVLHALGQRILDLESDLREEHAALQTFQHSPQPDEGDAPLSPELVEQVERLQQWSAGVHRVASTAPPGGRRESTRAYLQRPPSPVETVEREEPEEGRQEWVAAQHAAERVPVSERPSGQIEARVERRSERSEPEEGRQEREAAQRAAQHAAERVPVSERPSGQIEARVERRSERLDPPQPAISQSALESARREERIERGEIIWEDVPDLVGRRLGTGLLAIAIIGLAVGAGIISGGTALIFAADLVAVSWMSSYFERREEIERSGYNVPIPNTALTAFGDAIGLSQFIQGVTGLELGTGRRLSGIERTSNVSTGSADLMLLAGLLMGSRAFLVGRTTGQRSGGAAGLGRQQAAIERSQGRFGREASLERHQAAIERSRGRFGQREIGETREVASGRNNPPSTAIRGEELSPPSATSASANAEAQAAVELSEGGAVQGINRPALMAAGERPLEPHQRGRLNRSDYLESLLQRRRISIGEFRVLAQDLIRQHPILSDLYEVARRGNLTREVLDNIRNRFCRRHNFTVDEVPEGTLGGGEDPNLSSLRTRHGYYQIEAQVLTNPPTYLDELVHEFVSYYLGFPNQIPSIERLPLPLNRGLDLYITLGEDETLSQLGRLVSPEQ